MVGITDSTDDTLLGLICDRVNSYIESETRQPVAPITSATYLYDHDGLTTRVFTPMPVGASTLGIGGLRAITLLEFAPYTAGTFETITSTDYFLRGRVGVQGPYKWLVMSDRIGGSYTRSYSKFAPGRAAIRVTATAGWAAIPDDLIRVALEIAARDWYGRAGSGTASEEAIGLPPLRVLNSERETMWNYRLASPT
jgi:hypothetical protein